MATFSHGASRTACYLACYARVLSHATLAAYPGSKKPDLPFRATRLKRFSIAPPEPGQTPTATDPAGKGAQLTVTHGDKGPRVTGHLSR